MKVADICTREVKSCTVGADLASAAMIMWDNECGVLPIVDEAGKAIAVITDRDICIAASTRNKPPSEILVGEAMSRRLYKCRMEDDVRRALHIMATCTVRRLPVTDENGVLQGILSIDDLVRLASEDLDRDDLSYRDIMNTLKTIAVQYRRKKQVLQAIAPRHNT